MLQKQLFLASAIVMTVGGTILACGSSGTNIGTEKGVSFNVKDMISDVYSAVNPNSTQTYTVANVVLADFTGVCETFTEDSAPPGNTVILTVLSDSNTVVPGSYSFSGPNQGAGGAVYFVNSTITDPATSGSITLTTVGTDGAIAGSFDATFADGHLAGSFDGTACSNLSVLGTF